MILMSIDSHRSPMNTRTSALVFGLESDDDSDDDDDDDDDDDENALALRRGSSTVLNPNDERWRSSACFTASCRAVSIFWF